MDKITIYLGADCIISSLGNSTEENIRQMEAGCSGIRQVDDPAVFERPFPAGRISEESDESDSATPRLERWLKRVVEHVLAESGVSPQSPRTGLIVATTKGNIDYLCREPKPDTRCFLFEMAQRVARELGFVTRPKVISNACISGLAAMIVARRELLQRHYDHVVVVGGDLLSQFVVSGFHSFKSVSENICRPYDALRDGLSLGEACGALLLTTDVTRAKCGRVMLAGGAMTQDANHLSAPSRTGEELAAAIRQAMCEGGVTATEIDAVNAHGTATRYNDEMESKALAVAGLSDKPLNSFKPYIGHTLGAAGVVEAILSAEQIRRGEVFATPGYEECGVPQPVNVASRHRKMEITTMVKSASGFGGCNAAVVLSRDHEGLPLVARDVQIATTRSYSLSGHGDFAERIRAEYKALGSANLKFFKMDNLAKLGYVAAEHLLRDDKVAERWGAFRVGIILSNRSSSLDTDLRHQRIVESHPEEGASPAVFVYTLPNIVIGEISIRHGIKGEGLFFVEPSPEGHVAEDYARRLIASDILDAAVTGWCECLEENYSVNIKLIEKI